MNLEYIESRRICAPRSVDEADSNLVHIGVADLSGNWIVD